MFKRIREEIRKIKEEYNKPEMRELRRQIACETYANYSCFLYY